MGVKMKFLFSSKARKERQRLKERTDLLKYVLQDKNIPGNISGAVSGPLLDVFTYTPCTGIAPSQIFDLAIANNGSAKVMRETGDVQICLPRDYRTMVWFPDLLKSRAFKKNTLNLPVVLGVNEIGNPVVADLLKLGNILICGNRGTGKTYLVYSLILSVSQHFAPDDITFVMLDTMGEYFLFNDLPHTTKRILSPNPTGELIALLNIVKTRPTQDELPHAPIVLIVDKISDLKPQAQEILIDILMDGPAKGVYCIATGDISYRLPEKLQACFDTNIVFNMSRKALRRILQADSNGLSLCSYGDAVVRTKAEPPIRIHTPYASDDTISKIVGWHVQTNVAQTDLHKTAYTYIIVNNPSITDIQRKFGISYIHATLLRERANIIAMGDKNDRCFQEDKKGI